MSSSSAAEQASTLINDLTLNAQPSPSAADAKSNLISLLSSDNVTFQVEEKAATVSQLLHRLIEDGCSGAVIPLPNVQAQILEFVADYCTRHADSREIKDEDKEDLKSFDMDKLFEVIRAANYLEIRELLDLACQTAAEAIKDMMPDQVRKIFGVENDYTEEEEQALRNENAWAFDV